jgi:hypothetical protein
VIVLLAKYLIFVGEPRGDIVRLSPRGRPFGTRTGGQRSPPRILCSTTTAVIVLRISDPRPARRDWTTLCEAATTFGASVRGPIGLFHRSASTRESANECPPSALNSPPPRRNFGKATASRTHRDGKTGPDRTLARGADVHPKPLLLAAIVDPKFLSKHVVCDVTLPPRGKYGDRVVYMIKTVTDILICTFEMFRAH